MFDIYIYQTAVGDRFSSHVTGTSYTVNHRLDCNSRNVVYLISCKVCGVQYVGSTTTKFRLRFNNHKSRLRAHSKMSAASKDKDDAIYRSTQRENFQNYFVFDQNDFLTVTECYSVDN